MNTQFLFYQKVVPVSPARHGKWSIDRSVDYRFAKGVSSVPLTAVEIPYAAREYTIVFQGKGVPTPVVLLGIGESGDNLT